MKELTTQITHGVLALVALGGIIALQLLGKDNGDVMALLGAVVGYSGQTSVVTGLTGKTHD